MLQPGFYLSVVFLCWSVNLLHQISWENSLLFFLLFRCQSRSPLGEYGIEHPAEGGIAPSFTSRAEKGLNLGLRDQHLTPPMAGINLT